MKIEAINEFLNYVEKQIAPAIEDVAKLPDASRKHVQRLIYTNLADRFDAMIDILILQNCRSSFLAEKATGKMTGNITEADLIKLLMQEQGDIQETIDEKLKDTLRNSILRERHSRKLATLFELAGKKTAEFVNKPRVSINNGHIRPSVKVGKNNTVPRSICGYADWLYSRRNGLVHGEGRCDLCEKDLNQIEKIYGVRVAQSFRIKLSSTTLAATFYKDIANILKSRTNT